MKDGALTPVLGQPLVAPPWNSRLSNSAHHAPPWVLGSRQGSSQEEGRESAGGPPLGSAVPLGPGRPGPVPPNTCTSFEGGGVSPAPGAWGERRYHFRRGEAATAVHPRAGGGGLPGQYVSRGGGPGAVRPKGCTLPPSGRPVAPGGAPRHGGHLSCRVGLAVPQAGGAALGLHMPLPPPSCGGATRWALLKPEGWQEGGLLPPKSP